MPTYPIHWGLVVAGLLAATIAPAQSSIDDQYSAFAIQRTATALGEYGDRHRDALALIMAARMSKQVGATLSDAVRKPGGPAPTAHAKRALDPSIKAMLARAREYARGRADLIALANEAEAAGSRGTVRGAKQGESTLLAASVEELAIKYSAGEAFFGLIRTGDSLEIEVKDPAERPQPCIGRKPGALKECSWRPERDGVYRVTVSNKGQHTTSYKFYHN